MKTTKTIIIIGATAVLAVIGFYPVHKNSRDIRKEVLSEKEVVKPIVKDLAYEKRDPRNTIPNNGTDWYTYMDLESITDKSSEQYRRKSNYWLDSSGIWCCNNDYVVAMGSGFGALGDRYMIITDKGNSYSVVIGDHKADIDTDLNNCYSLTYVNGEPKFNIIEFIVDTDSLNDNVKESGNVGDYYFIKGNIIHIEKIP